MFNCVKTRTTLFKYINNYYDEFQNLEDNYKTLFPFNKVDPYV